MRRTVLAAGALLAATMVAGVFADTNRPAAAEDAAFGELDPTAMVLPDLAVPPEPMMRGTGAPAGAPVGAERPTPEPAVARQTWAYGPHGERNTMDVFSPAGHRGGPLPTVVLVHGGSWVKGSKEAFAAAARDFAGDGYVAAAINYRLATQAPWPAQREDVIRAVEALKRNADRFDVDPRRMVLIGSSAGAHLVAAAGTYGTGLDLVRGFVALSGPMDLVALAASTESKGQNLARLVADDLLRCRLADCPARYADASPGTRLSADDAPSLLIASQDEWVPSIYSLDFAADAARAGVESEMLMLDGDGHAMELWDEAWPAVRDWVEIRMATPQRG